MADFLENSISISGNQNYKTRNICRTLLPNPHPSPDIAWIFHTACSVFCIQNGKLAHVQNLDGISMKSQAKHWKKNTFENERMVKCWYPSIYYNVQLQYHFCVVWQFHSWERQSTTEHGGTVTLISKALSQSDINKINKHWLQLTPKENICRNFVWIHMTS